MIAAVVRNATTRRAATTRRTGIVVLHSFERRHRGGRDDFVDLAELGQVTRHGLKEAFRNIARAQKGLATEFGVTLR